MEEAFGCVQFVVIGSTGSRYTVQFHRNGTAVRAFCNCPAGRRGGLLCKHVKYAIEGSSDVLTEESDDREALLKIIAGTELEAKASSYIPPEKRERIQGCGSISELFNQYGDEIQRMGISLEYAKEEGEYPVETLSAYEFFKNGKLRRTPTATIQWRGMIEVIEESEDGIFVTVGLKPRTMCYTVMGKKKSGDWKDVQKACYAFLFNLGIN